MVRQVFLMWTSTAWSHGPMIAPISSGVLTRVTVAAAKRLVHEKTMDSQVKLGIYYVYICIYMYIYSPMVYYLVQFIYHWYIYIHIYIYTQIHIQIHGQSLVAHRKQIFCWLWLLSIKKSKTRNDFALLLQGWGWMFFYGQIEVFLGKCSQLVVSKPQIDNRSIIYKMNHLTPFSTAAIAM